jgi:N4-gp56 family major capsid protein
MTRTVIERAQTYASMIRALNPDVASMRPVSIEGEGRYVHLMSEFQAFDLRVSDTAGWLEMNKALVTAEGKNSPIFKGGLGMLNNTVLHAHESVVRFSDYGAGTNLPASRSLFMGRQAGVVAYGTAGQGMGRFSWFEETDDFSNLINIAAGCIMGMKKTRFNGRDYGVLAIDTYAASVK